MPLQRYLLIAFGLHLLLPLVFLADSLLPTRRSLSTSEACLAAVAAAWLAGGFALLGLSRLNSRLQTTLAAATVSLGSVLVSCAIAETALYIQEQPLDPGPTLMTPGARVVTVPDPRYLPGVAGMAVGRINQLGMRGPSTKLLAGRGNVYKIFTIGGSTTICDYLDDSEAWPNLLMEGLNRRQDRRFVFVSNAAITQHSSAHHLELLRSMPVLRDADLLVFLVGINDLVRTLQADGASSRQRIDEAAQQIRSTLANSLYANGMPRYKRLRLFQLAQRIVGGWGKEGHDGTQFRDFRRTRAQYPIVPLPDLNVGLAEYRELLGGMIQHCRDSGQRCLFLTQPTLWRDDLTAEEERLLWIGGIGPSHQRKGYGAPAALAQAMNAFNQALLDVCRESGAEVYDLAAAAPKDTTIFYDDCHFTEHGARVVAGLLADWVAGRPPFAATPLR